MKLFVIASLIAISSAARLEHLEQQQQLRAYLPPHQRSSFGPNGGFGGSHGSLGFHSGAHGSFGAGSNGFDGAGVGQPGFNAHAAFPGASSKYLPPNQGSADSVSVDAPQFAGSARSFGGHNEPSHQFGHHDASPQSTNTFGAHASFQPQPSAAGHHHVAPHSSHDLVQQPFDEQTGYHY